MLGRALFFFSFRQLGDRQLLGTFVVLGAARRFYHGTLQENAFQRWVTVMQLLRSNFTYKMLSIQQTEREKDENTSAASLLVGEILYASLILNRIISFAWRPKS